MQSRRPARQPQATVRFETAPGQQAQVDWSSFGTIAHEGRHRRLYAFVMTLGWSRMLHPEFTIWMEITWFLRGHLHAFAYSGGAPRAVPHDNLKTAVLDRAADGTIHWHPRYLDFASYYGFTPRACRPYRAQTKGKVERGIGYVRGNFEPGVHAEGLADLNAQARLWLDTVVNVRRHGTTGVVPFTRLPDEGLLPLAGKPPYDTSLVLTRQSTRDGLVRYAGNLYSVPITYAQQCLLLRATEQGELLILTPQGHEVAWHTLARGQQQRIIQAAHDQDLRAVTTPPAPAPLILAPPRPPHSGPGAQPPRSVVTWTTSVRRPGLGRPSTPTFPQACC